MQTNSAEAQQLFLWWGGWSQRKAVFSRGTRHMSDLTDHKKTLNLSIYGVEFWTEYNLSQLII